MRRKRGRERESDGVIGEGGRRARLEKLMDFLDFVRLFWAIYFQCLLIFF